MMEVGSYEVKNKRFEVCFGETIPKSVSEERQTKTFNVGIAIAPLLQKYVPRCMPKSQREMLILLVIKFQ
jgi:hypothetical protein